MQLSLITSVLNSNKVLSAQSPRRLLSSIRLSYCSTDKHYRWSRRNYLRTCPRGNVLRLQNIHSRRAMWTKLKEFGLPFKRGYCFLSHLVTQNEVLFEKSTDFILFDFYSSLFAFNLLFSPCTFGLYEQMVTVYKYMLFPFNMSITITDKSIFML